jgi:DnaJ-domain-containing protein 1
MTHTSDDLFAETVWLTADPGAPAESPPKTPTPRTPQETLGVAAGASIDEIRAAHRRLLIAWHPDRFIGRSAEEQRNAERRLGDVNEAYHELIARRRR